MIVCGLFCFVNIIMTDFILLQKTLILEIIVPYMKQLGLDLNLIRIYVKIVEFKSFSETSRNLNIPKSTLSRSVTALEKELGLQLILRTTRQFSLTHQGERFYQDCKKILIEFDNSLSQITKNKEGTHGKIKLTAPLDFGEAVLNPLIIEFSQQYPQIEFELSYTDDIVNIVREGFDLALRIGDQKDSRLKTKKVCETSFIIVASPLFIQQNVLIQDSRDLANLIYIHFGRIKDLASIRFTAGREFFVIKNKPQIIVNHLQSLKAMVMADKGFAMLPDFFVKAELQKGQLIQLFKNHRTTAINVSWVMPEHKENSALIRNFRDFITPKIARLL